MFSVERVNELIVQTKFEPCGVCAVDQFLNNDFNLNDCGWLRNDLSALAAATTREQYEEILRRLKELPATSSLPKDVKLKDAFNLIKPRMCQTENEFADFVGFMTKQGIENADAAYAVEVSKKLAENSAESDVASSSDVSNNS